MLFTKRSVDNSERYSWLSTTAHVMSDMFYSVVSNRHQSAGEGGIQELSSDIQRVCLRKRDTYLTEVYNHKSRCETFRRILWNVRPDINPRGMTGLKPGDNQRQGRMLPRVSTSK